MTTDATLVQKLDRLATTAWGGVRELAPQHVPLQGVQLIDVREPHEFTGELAHVPGSRLVPLGTLTQHAPTWDRAQVHVLICRSGARSGRATEYMQSMGFQHVFNMTGGMIAYNQAGLPVER